MTGRETETDVPKNVVVCLDGTNNQVRDQANTNVVRLYQMLDLADGERQTAFYAPGVGTFSAAGAWTPLARRVSRLEGLAFGVGLRHELADAYRFLMTAFEDDNTNLFVFGFSRGAYTARALSGLLDLIGLFRPGAENLVPYAVSVYADPRAGRVRETLRTYAKSFSRVIGGRTDRVPIHFMGLWDTVKAAGTLRGQLRWPYTVHLPQAATVRHAMAIDETRRPYAAYPVAALDTAPADALSAGRVAHQDLQQVWFAGVHSDVGGMFRTGARLSDIPLKWMAQQAAAQGLIFVPGCYDDVMRQVTPDDATGAPHVMSPLWKLVGTRRRVVPPGSDVHASVRDRIAADPAYARRVPDAHFVDPDWLTSM